MDGHARTSGRVTDKIRIAGQEYTLRTPTVGTLIAEMEAYVVSLRSNPFSLAAEAADRLPIAMPEPRRRAVVDRIWQAAEQASIRAGAATAAETAAFENSLRGIAWKFWVCIRDDHPVEVPNVDVALSLLERYMEETGRDEDALREIVERTSAVTGETLAKNSSGPTRKRAGKRKASRKRKSPDGPRS